MIVALCSNVERRFSKIGYSGIYVPRKSLPSGTFCLVAVSYGKLSKEELEAVRRLIRRRLKKKGVLRFRAFPTLPLTKKPLQSRMGKGKGRIDRYVCPVYPGKIILELSGITKERAFEALYGAKLKFSLPMRIGLFSEIYG